MSSAVLIQFLLCPVVFIALMRTTAPYGRHFVPGWGATLPNRTAWFLMEIPALLLIAVLLLATGSITEPLAFYPWLMWTIHYGYRSFIFPALMRPSGRSFPVLLVVFAIAFNSLNGYNNAQALIQNAQTGGAFFSPGFVFGSILYFFGFWLHVSADHAIRNLRSADFSGYRIPRGGWFQWTSNPNYFGEILQWAGWAVLTWSWAGLAFALFTFCNLAPRAIANHRWYQRSFPDYPADRRILIPGVF